MNVGDFVQINNRHSAFHLHYGHVVIIYRDLNAAMVKMDNHPALMFFLPELTVIKG